MKGNSPGRAAGWWAGALALFLLAGGAGAAGSPDRPLGEVLAELARGDLAAHGWTLVFSSELVRPEMRVEAGDGDEGAGERVSGDAGAGPARRRLNALLALHGLEVQEVVPGLLVVVRGDPTPRPRHYVEDTIDVRPSRYKLIDAGRDPGSPRSPLALGRDEIGRLPHLGDDPFRTVTLLPGTAGSDVSARFSVRGGRRDEVRVMLDGLELYEPYHLPDYDGALSLVSARGLEGMTLTTGAYPADLGDRMSGVLDLRTLRPAGPRLVVALGALDATLTASGPLPGGRSGAASGASSGSSSEAASEGEARADPGGWLVTGRRGSLALAGDAVGDERPSLWDGLAKVEIPTRAGRFALRGLAAEDRLRVDTAEDEDFERLDNDWSSAYGWLTHGWSNDRLLVESLASWTGQDRDRRAEVREEEGEYALRDRRDMSVVTLSQDYSLRRARGVVRWGWEARRYRVRFDYAKDLELDLVVAAPFSAPRRTVHEFRDTRAGNDLALWASHRLTAPAVAGWRPPWLERMTAELGLRYDRHQGSDGTVLSPRVNLAWSLGRARVLRLAWGRFTQSQRPYELQVEDGENRLWPVERSSHWVLGYEEVFAHAPAEGAGPRLAALRVELYHRTVANPRPRYESLLEPLNFFPEVEPDRVRLAPESSSAYGVELLLQGRWGRRLEGFLAYTGSRSEDRLGGRVVPRRFDQGHALRADLGWRLPRRWALNLAWRFHTGWPTTPVETLPAAGGEEAEDEPVARFGALYGRRLPDYHRLDLRVSRRWDLAWGRLTAYADVQNLYDRRNAAGFDLVLEEGEEGGAVEGDEGEAGAERLALEAESWPGVVPTVGVVLEVGGWRN